MRKFSVLKELVDASRSFPFLNNLSILKELFHTYWTFPYPCNFFMLVEFSDLWNLFFAMDLLSDCKCFSVLIKLSFYHGTSQCFWNFSSFLNFFMMTELYHASRTFPYTWNFAMLMEIKCVWKFCMLIVFVHAPGTFPCS